MKFAFFPIYSLGFRWSESQFDLTKLPYEIAPNLAIENVSPLLPDNAFELWKPMLGENVFKRLERLEYALIHRFDDDSEANPANHSLLNFAVSCLRIIRPMRQGVLTNVHGRVADDGKLDVQGFGLAERQSGVEVVEAHKLATLRTEDAETLRTLLPNFARAMSGDFWKFRMAVQFHDLGYFQSYNWMPRFLLWASALESIYTSHNREHQGSRVAIARIKWFLGENTQVYYDATPLRTIPECTLTLNDVLDDLYEFRNFVAHGDRIPDKFFNSFPRQGVNGGVCKLEVLSEAASFVIRHSLIRILQEGLLDQFADAGPAEAFFGAHNLINSRL